MEGAIGEITGGVVYWNQSMLWFRERQKDWNDCEYMIKDLGKLEMVIRRPYRGTACAQHRCIHMVQRLETG